MRDEPLNSSYTWVITADSSGLDQDEENELEDQDDADDGLEEEDEAE